MTHLADDMAWTKMSLSDFVLLQRGHDLTWRQRKSGKVPVMGSAGVNGTHDCAIASGPGVVLGRSGASFGQAHYVDRDYWPHNTTLYVTDFRGNDPRFAYYLLSFVDFTSYNSGGAQQSLNRNFIASIAVNVPSIPEQRRIVTALDDASDEISGLERLIAKKQGIRQGMMQQLLTGRTRLPGFTASWIKQCLGDVTRIKTGSRNNQDKKSGGKYPFFVRSATVERIDTYSYDCEAILVPGEGGIGSIFHYINGKFEVHQRVYKISDFSNGASGRFIYYYMRQYFGAHAMENSVKATVDSLRLPTFKNFLVQLPSSDEQDAIVSILDDVETELSTLRDRLQKARAVKTGMMQELLTGRTRLPVEVTS